MEIKFWIFTFSKWKDVRKFKINGFLKFKSSYKFKNQKQNGGFSHFEKFFAYIFETKPYLVIKPLLDWLRKWQELNRQQILHSKYNKIPKISKFLIFNVQNFLICKSKSH